MLALDCGNTALKCIYKGEFISFLTHEVSFEKDFSSYLLNIPKSEQVVLSCVSSKEIEAFLLETLNDYFDQSIEIVQTEKSFKTLKNGYDNPAELGVDRWLAMIACYSAHQATLVVDAGSWIKMDAILKNGQHLGGVIISKTKNEEQQLLERFNVTLNKEINNGFGKSTHECISLVANHYGDKAVLKTLVHWIAQIGSDCSVFIGGGDGKKLFLSLQKQMNKSNKYLDIQLNENLVLSGLLIRYQN